MNNSREVLHAYRQLYRASLRAIQYASPARHTLRKLIDTEFRLNKLHDFDRIRVDNTLIFLDGAAKVRGLEHRIVKTLLHVWWFWEGSKKVIPKYYLSASMRGWGVDSYFSHKALKPEEARIRQSSFNHYRITLRMLNNSMQLCLPTDPSRKRDPLDYL